MGVTKRSIKSLVWHQPNVIDYACQKMEGKNNPMHQNIFPCGFWPTENTRNMYKDSCIPNLLLNLIRLLNSKTLIWENHFQNLRIQKVYSLKMYIYSKLDNKTPYQIFRLTKQNFWRKSLDRQTIYFYMCQWLYSLLFFFCSLHFLRNGSGCCGRCIFFFLLPV